MRRTMSSFGAPMSTGFKSSSAAAASSVAVRRRWISVYIRCALFAGPRLLANHSNDQLDVCDCLDFVAGLDLGRASKNYLGRKA